MTLAAGALSWLGSRFEIEDDDTIDSDIAASPSYAKDRHPENDHFLRRVRGVSDWNWELRSDLLQLPRPTSTSLALCSGGNEGPRDQHQN
jgi:hypothetical protein